MLKPTPRDPIMTLHNKTLSPIDPFHGKATLYEQFRRHYPVKCIGNILNSLPNTEGNVIADIGAGTGFLSIPLANANNTVYHIEPNQDFNNVAIAKLDLANMFADNYPNPLVALRQSRIITSSATQTTLEDNSVDLITMGNSAHWLEPNGKDVLAEFGRILKPNGKVAILYYSLPRTKVGDIPNPIVDKLDKCIKKFIINKQRELINVKPPGDLIDAVIRFIYFPGSTISHEEFCEAFSFEQLIGYVQTLAYSSNVLEHDCRNALQNIFEEHAQQSNGCEKVLEVPFMAELFIGSLSTQQNRIQR